MKEEEIARKVKKVLDLVDLEGFENRSVSTLSGGQQQRIAIARALVNEPQILLLDEPLGALDLKMRKEMQLELKQMHDDLGITFIYVTHDQEEALTMSDRIVVMSEGKMQQLGTPEDIYNEPKNAFVANFIGESNIVDGVMERDFAVTFAGRTFDCVDKGFAVKEAVDVVIRPEDLVISTPERGQIVGRVDSVVFKGIFYEIMVIGETFTWKVQTTRAPEVGQMVGLSVDPDNIQVMHKS
jgi:spermidine/putrescine transport system ATP-binding protein